MKKVYRLNFFTNPNGNYKEGFFIGIFKSSDEAENIANHYKNNIEGFNIYECEYSIDEVNVMGEEDTETLYSFCGWNINDVGDEIDIIYSDYYTDKSVCEAEFEKIKQHTFRAEWVIGNDIVGKCNWEDGFVRIYEDEEKTFCYTYFRIVGEFHAEDVIKLLGIEPFKNDEGGNGICTNLDFSLCDEYDVLVENMMRKTIEPFKDKVDILNSIREKYDVNFFLEVVPSVYVDETHPVLAPPLDVMEFCVKTQTEIDIDMYVF